MSDTPHLREVVEDDCPTLLRLLHAAFQEYDGALDPPSGAHRETLDSVRARLAEGTAILAICGEAPAGFAFYQPQDDYVYFSRLSVLPAFRNQGIGRALIEYVERRAAENGAEGVRLGVRTQLPHLIARYQRLGYRITKQMTHDGYSQPTYVYMEKHVAGSR
jgi:ribosomal protein S18 acetylase RimI-like enzyme